MLELMTKERRDDDAKRVSLPRIRFARFDGNDCFTLIADRYFSCFMLIYVRKFSFNWIDFFILLLRLSRFRKWESKRRRLHFHAKE